MIILLFPLHRFNISTDQRIYYILIYMFIMAQILGKKSIEKSIDAIFCRFQYYVLSIEIIDQY